MNFYKIFFISNVFGLNAYASALSSKDKIIKLCHVSSPIAGILPRAQSYVLSNIGFKLAVKEFSEKSSRKAVFLEYKPRQQELAVPEGIKWAKENECSVVVGLISSRDALVAAPFLRDAGIIGFSSTATSDELSKMFPHILSASTSSGSNVEAISKFVEQDKRPVTVLVKPSDLFSNTYYSKIKTSIPNARFVVLDKNGVMSRKDMESMFLKKGGEVILYTTYPFESLPSLEQLSTWNRPQRSHP